MNKKSAAGILPVVFSMMLFSSSLLMAQTDKGIELYKSWKFKEAEQAFQEALKTAPQDLSLRYYLGLSLLMQDKHSEALEVFLNAREEMQKAKPKSRPSVPDDYQINLALARTYLELKEDTEAWKSLDLAEKAQPKAADTFVYRGVYYLHRQENQKAADELDKAISLDANNAYAYYYAGHAHIRLGNPAKAVEMLKMFLQLEPSAPEAEKAKALVSALC